VLALWADEDNWAKLCLEYSPRGEPMVVSVVTRGLSDDCNSAVVDGSVTWLRMSRIGQAYAFHSSADGQEWHLVRHFALASGESPEVGFQAQSPTGDGCTARFDQIRFEARTLADIRSGA
jgi:regulation of enolase protein 1 (concanavalin A-like superfamily)